GGHESQVGEQVVFLPDEIKLAELQILTSESQLGAPSEGVVEGRAPVGLEGNESWGVDGHNAVPVFDLQAEEPPKLPFTFQNLSDRGKTLRTELLVLNTGLFHILFGHAIGVEG